jgi:hypothetical protein
VRVTLRGCAGEVNQRDDHDIDRRRDANRECRLFSGERPAFGLRYQYPIENK